MSITSTKVKNSANEMNTDENYFHMIGGYTFVLDYIKKNRWTIIFTPYVPSLHSPGWLIRLFFGPYDIVWRESLFGNITAGITVAAIAIPQVSAKCIILKLPSYSIIFSSS